MISFLFRHLLTARLRSLWVIFFASCIIISGFLGIFLYKNTIAAIDFYTESSTDPQRLVLKSEGSLIDMFSRESGGINMNTLEKMKQDPRVKQVQTFTFADIAIFGRFSLFSFAIESDIPVFWVDDSLHEIEGFGISPSMIHYYNLELAGTHPMLPHLDEEFIRGQQVILHFGASKLFPHAGSGEVILTGSITQIDHDFPGFGIVIPYKKMAESMRALGYEPRTPYKAIIKLKDEKMLTDFRKEYGERSIEYMIDAGKDQERRLWVLRIIFIGTGGGLSVLFLWLLYFLFSGYFREQKNATLLSLIYAIWKKKTWILSFGWPILLIVFGWFFAGVCIAIFHIFLFPLFWEWLRIHGIMVPIISLTSTELIWFLGLLILIFLSLLLCARWPYRK